MTACGFNRCVTWKILPGLDRFTTPGQGLPLDAAASAHYPVPDLDNALSLSAVEKSSTASPRESSTTP
jgi:hypothetical protein